MVEQRGSDEEAFFVPLEAEPAAVDDQLGAFIDPQLDIVLDPLTVRSGYAKARPSIEKFLIGIGRR